MAFSGYQSSKPVPTALREREDDILPYGGWEILAGTIQPDAPKCTCHYRKNVTGRVRALAGLVTVLRAALKNRAGQGTGWIGTSPKGVTKNLPVSTAVTNRVGQGTGWIGTSLKGVIKKASLKKENLWHLMRFI